MKSVGKEILNSRTFARGDLIKLNLNVHRGAPEPRIGIVLNVGNLVLYVYWSNAGFQSIRKEYVKNVSVPKR